MALPSQAPSNSGTHARQIRSAPAPRFLLSSLVFAVSSPRRLVSDDACLCSGRGSAVPGALARLRRPARHRPPRRRPRLLLPPGTHRAGTPPSSSSSLLPLEPWLAPFAADADLECSQVEASMNQVAGNPMRLYDLPSKLLCRVLNVELKVPSSSAPVFFLPSLV
jgi:hypothetical protein